MSLDRRVQILLDPDQFRQVERDARRTNQSMAGVIREAIEVRLSAGAAGSGRIRSEASVEMVQELLFHRLRRADRRTAVTQARDAAALCALHEFGRPDLARTLDLATAQLGRSRTAARALRSKRRR